MPPGHPLRLALAALAFAMPLRADEALLKRCWSLALSEPKEVGALVSGALAKTRDASVVSQLRLCRGYALEQAGHVNEAMAEYESVMPLVERSGDKQTLVDALSLRGELRHYRGDFIPAIEDLQRAYALASQLGAEKQQRYVLNAIANLYADRRVAAYDRAIEYYRQLLEAHERAGNDAGVATAVFNIAATLDTKGDTAASLVEYRRALELERKRKDPIAIADVQRGLGIVLGKLDRNAEALATLDEALAAYVKVRDEESIAQVRLARGTVLRKLGRPAEAARELEAARARFELTKSNRFLEKTHDELALTYSVLGDWRAAYAARADQFKVRETLSERQREEHLSRLRVQFESEKKEQENRALLRENALRARALEDAGRIRKLQAIVIVLSAVVVAFLIGVARRMRRLALTDDLTKLPNRRRVMSVADERVRSARSHGSALSLLAIDIDHFKQINDTYGHDAGDVVLRRVAEACRRALRSGDEIGRTGGEEFLVVLPGTDGHTAAEVAERVRAAVERIEVSEVQPGLKITVSIGVTEWQPADDFGSVAKRADDLLYMAKQSGRNRVAAA
jgi:diguanylate cyclase (GGDEF)-like protein